MRKRTRLSLRRTEQFSVLDEAIEAAENLETDYVKQPDGKIEEDLKPMLEKLADIEDPTMLRRIILLYSEALSDSKDQTKRARAKCEKTERSLYYKECLSSEIARENNRLANECATARTLFDKQKSEMEKALQHIKSLKKENSRLKKALETRMPMYEDPRFTFFALCAVMVLMNIFSVIFVLRLAFYGSDYSILRKIISCLTLLIDVTANIAAVLALRGIRKHLK